MNVEVSFEKNAVGSLHTHSHEQISYVVSGSFEYELQDGAICRMGFFSYYDAGGPGEAFTVRPADSRPGN